MPELTSMMNIGREMEKKLISVGIESSEELIGVGAKDAFFRRKTEISKCMSGTFIYIRGSNP